LNVHKHIQTGEGGIVVTDNDDLAMKIRMAMNHSEAVMNDINRQATDELKSTYIDGLINLVGLNLRMTELSAAIAREQLKKLDSILAVYQGIGKHLPVKVRPECTSAFYKYAIADYDAFYKKYHPVDKEGNMPTIMGKEIAWKRHYIDPIYKMPLFKSMGYEPGLCPVCEKVEENIVLAWFKEVV